MKKALQSLLPLFAVIGVVITLLILWLAASLSPVVALAVLCFLFFGMIFFARKTAPHRPAGEFKVITRDSSEAQEHKLFRIPRKDNGKSSVASEEKPTFKIKRKKMFGTAGIRGLTNIEITPLLALKIGQVYGDYLGNQGKVAIGYDTRYGSPMLAQAATSGLMSAGIDVVNCGCLPTGALACQIVRAKLDGGLIITGSHTPYDRSGLIIFMADGSYLADGMARNIEKRYYELDKRQVRVAPEKIGRVSEEPNVLKAYREFLLSLIKEKEAIRNKHYKVLIDPANGTGILAFPPLLKELGCEVIFINEDPKPKPNREAEPRARNLGPAATRLTEHQGNLGIALDIDSDRALFIDETGQVLSEDLVGSIFARDIFENLSGKKLCVTPVNSSGLIEHTCQKTNSQLEYCGIGQPATLQVIRDLKADFSYEESGKYYFCRETLWADGILAGLKMLEIMARTGKTLKQLTYEFPVFYQVKHTRPCPNHLKNRLMKKVREIWEKEVPADRRKDVTLDGLKRVYQDQSWLLIRKSGTEPLIRVYSDAQSQNRAEELVKTGEAIIDQALLEIK
ncbi:MAG: hypothetical protein KAS70_04035 [Planctomycetes bacterium]|nr:hypothetical protein [Planctomycetota bacterium]